MKKLLLLTLLPVLGYSTVYAQDEFDDIYYNPAKQSQTKSKKSRSSYNPDFQNQDVDAYNRRGQYYVTPVDTIGEAAENAEDFVYTQQIQKYYNPTIVVDNAALLGDILDNTYGNVNIIYNNGIPYFDTWYSWPYYAYNPWRWNLSIGGWGWNLSWNSPWYNPWYPGGWYDPWYGPSWGWGPGWAWRPSWDWGWGPGWRPGRPYYADYRPGGLRPAGARPGWSTHRPGYHGNVAGHRPGGSNHYGRPASGNTANQGYRPNGSSSGSRNPIVTSNGHRISGDRVQNGSNNTYHSPSSYPSNGRQPGSNRGGYNSTRPSSGHSVTPRPATSPSVTNRQPSVQNQRSVGSQRGGYNSNRSSGSSTQTRNYSSPSRSSSESRSYNNSNSGRSYNSSPSYNRGSSGGGYRGGGSSRGGYGGGGRRR